MKFFTNRAVAVMIVTILVLGSTLANAKIKLADECSEVQDTFFTSSETSKCPYYYVNSHISTVAALASVGEHYTELTDVTQALRDARKELVAAYESKDISDIFDANEELLAVVMEFERAASTVTMDSDDSATYADCVNNFDGGQDNLDSASYNSDVRTFLRNVYDRFPASLLADITGVTAPELYE